MTNHTLSLAWRLFRHETKRGELTIILLAIILSVASVLSLSLFSERLKSALTEKSAEFIAADRVLDSSQAVDLAWIEKAQEMGLNTAHQTYARSMVFANEQMDLVDLRAAGTGYPLKGTVKVADEPFSLGVAINRLPQSGEAWIESQLFQTLAIKVGDNAYGVQFHAELTFAMVYKWTVKAEHRFSLHGAQHRRQHIEGRLLHDAAVRIWLHQFLDQWIGPAKEQNG